MFLAVDLDLRSRVLAEQDLVADLDVDRCHLAVIVLLALADRPLRIAERQDGEDLIRFGQPDLLADAFEAAEPRPVRADTIGPGREDHRLDGAAGVGNTAQLLRFVVGDHHRRGGARDVRPCSDQPAELTQRLLFLDQDEVPWLLVARAGAQLRRLEHAAQHVVRNGPVLILADGQHSPDDLEDSQGANTMEGDLENDPNTAGGIDKSESRVGARPKRR